MDATDIEISVERKMDRLDRHYMAGKLKTEDYQSAVKALDQWACAQYDAIAPDSMAPEGVSDAHIDQFHC